MGMKTVRRMKAINIYQKQHIRIKENRDLDRFKKRKKEKIMPHTK